jgi:hypothetical protein
MASLRRCKLGRCAVADVAGNPRASVTRRAGLCLAGASVIVQVAGTWLPEAAPHG